MKLTLASVLLVVAIASLSAGSAGAWGYGYWGGWGSGYYGSYGFRRRSAEPAKTSECTYFSNRAMLVCEAPSLRVECASELVMDKLNMPIPVVAIGRTPVGDIKDVKNVRYPLFFESDKDMWSRTYTDASTSKVYSFSLFFTPKVGELGLRIKDIACWRKMTTFFTGLTKFEQIRVGSQKIQVLGSVFNV
jgi:hypothetical protein